MKTIMKTCLALALVVMLVTLVRVGPVVAEPICPAAEQKGTPFHGNIRGSETNVVAFPALFVDGRGTGVATQLGKFEVRWLLTVDIAADPATSTGTFEFIAANGDHLFTDSVGAGPLTPISQITECNTITGGTGRFAGATGAFTIHRVLDLATGDTSGLFEGSIVMNKGKDTPPTPTPTAPVPPTPTAPPSPLATPTPTAPPPTAP